MAERPRYIATTNRTLGGQPSTNPRGGGPMTPTNPPAGESGELDRIRDKARRAKEFYNSIGLSNGDLLTHQQAQKEARRRSSSPDKHHPRSSGSGSVAYGWKDPGSNAYSKYGQTWVKPRSRPASKELDADLYQHPHHKNYTLPSKGHQHAASAAIDIRSHHSGSSGSIKSRSKSASCEINELKVGSNEDSHLRAEKTRPSPTKAPSLDDDERSASLTRAGRLPYKQQAEHPRALNGLPRIDSHLHRSNTSLNSDSGADGVSSEARDKSAMPPPSVETVTLFRGKLDRQRSSSDARSEKRASRSSDYLSASFDAADHARPKMASAARAFGSASTLDQALGDEDDGERQNPPSTKHLKKNRSDSRGASPTNSANASPRLPRKHKDKGSRSKSDVPDHKTLISRIARDDNARDVVDAMRQEMSYEEERRRRHHFAHYDWQSMLFSFRDVLTAMEGLKRKNTTTGASKAAALTVSTDSLGSKGSSVSGSMEDMSNFEDEGLENNKFNDLVSNCPFFRNEIGGEPERVVCIAASGNNASSSVSIQVGNGANSQEKTTIQARKVLTNHSFLSVVEGGNQETLLPPGSPPTGSVSFGIENRDEGACYYRQYFFDKEHQNFFGIDEKYGPVVISLRREKIEDSAGVAAYQYRVIVRTSELCTLRGSILEEAIHQSSSKHASTTKGIPPKEVLEYLCPEVNLSCLRVAVATPKVHEQLVKVDEQNVYRTYKIGVLYCRAKQSTEEEMYNNEHASPAFTEFLQLLGNTVKLNGFGEFRGGLDVKTDSTGTESVFTQFRDYKIMFHVSTMLPYTPNNRQQLLRKRHIGNDIMTIVFQEPGSEPFNPKNIRSHFQHVFLVIRAHQPCTSQTCYRVAVTRSRSIPRFGPPMPANCMFPKSPSFREFLLTKIINGENMVHKAGKFKAMAMNTRQEYLRDLHRNHSSQAGLEGKPNRFPFASASRRIRDGGREKQKSRPTPELLSRGALSWHVSVTDFNSPEVVPCLMGMSDCVLTLVEIASRQLIFSIPCQAVLGWTVPPPVADPAERGCYKRDLHVYYGRGERLSVQTDDVYSREEIIVRLERFTKGSETIYRQLHRNNRGELGFNVNYEGILSDGKAFQDGLRQSSRLVEICKVAVATMTHDEVLDLLRTSKVVKVVAIPPHDDGTPRKCSMELYHLAPILDVKPVPEGMTFQSFHDRTRSEPVHRSPSHPIYADAVDGLGVGHQRSESYNTSNTPKHQVHHDVSHTAGDLLLRDSSGGGKTRKSGKKSSKHGSRQNKELEEHGSRVVLFTAATRLAATVADSNGHSSASNTLSSTKSTFSNLSSQSGADIDFADVEDKRPSSNGAALQCSSSLSTDSGLNSNNNSSSTLSRVSTDTPTMSNQTLSYDEPWEESLHQHSYSFNQNSNNSISYGSMPRKNSSPATVGTPVPAGETPIIRVNWNPKPTNLSLGSSLPQEKGKPHSPFAVDCTPSSEVNRSLRVYIAGTEAHKNARLGQGQVSAPTTPSTHERLQMHHPPIHHSQSVGPSLHNTPTKWRNPHQPSRRTVVPQLGQSSIHNHVTPNTASPRTKRKSVTPHHASRVKSSTSKSVSNPHKTSTGGGAAHATDIQNTLIRLLAESPSKHQSPAKRPSAHRKSPARLGSQRTSPKRRTSSSDFSSDHLTNSHRASPTRLRVIQRTVSDESLCGARPDNLLLKRQESRQMKDAPRTLYSHHVSGSVDSLAPPPPLDRGRRRPHPAKTQPTNGNSPMLPLPDATSWDRLLDAAKAAEVFEASSVRSVSMGTLNDIGADEHLRHSSSINRNGVGYPAQRTMSVENLYDHEFRGNQGDPTNLLRKREPTTPTARPLFDLGEPPLDYAQSVMMSQSGMDVPGGQPSQSEQRLERIEMELRLLQDKLKKEQESKLELEREVHLLRRDNTLLQRHATPNDARHAHKRPKRKQQKS